MMRFLIKETIKKVGLDQNLISILENFPDSPRTQEEIFSRNSQHKILLIEKDLADSRKEQNIIANSYKNLQNEYNLLEQSQ